MPNRIVIPVVECYATQINIIIGSGRAVDNDCAKDSIGILGRVMTMIPEGAVLCSLECIQPGLTRSERTFSHTTCAVHGVCVQLTEPMPMDTCAIVFQLIHNSDPKRVAPFCATLESTDGTRSYDT